MTLWITWRLEPGDKLAYLLLARPASGKLDSPWRVLAQKLTQSSPKRRGAPTHNLADLKLVQTPSSPPGDILVRLPGRQEKTGMAPEQRSLARLSANAQPERLACRACQPALFAPAPQVGSLVRIANTMATDYLPTSRCSATL